MATEEEMNEKLSNVEVEPEGAPDDFEGEVCENA